MDPTVGIGIAGFDNCAKEVLECVYERLDLLWSSISLINKRLYVHSNCWKDPHRLERHVEEAVQMPRLIIDSELVRKDGSPLYFLESSEWHSGCVCVIIGGAIAWDLPRAIGCMPIGGSGRPRNHAVSE